MMLSYLKHTILFTVLIVLSGVQAFINLRGRTSHSKVDFDVVEKTRINATDTAGCLCDMGFFWHWRIHQCIPQGGWGYECGFFPKEHHHRVCADHLKCQLLRKERTYHTAKAAAGSCQPCQPEDKCIVGEERQKKECLKQYALEGETCVTIKVTTPRDAVASAKERVQASKTITKHASESSTQKARAEDTESVEATGSATESATVHKDVTVTATKKKTGSATASESATVSSDVTKEETAKASSTQSATQSASEAKTVEKEATATKKAEATKS